jgi:hypothetical protein
MGNGCEPSYTLEQEMQQCMAEHQAWIYYCLTQARAGKATEEEWDAIEAECGFLKQPILASHRYLTNDTEDQEPLPF